MVGSLCRFFKGGFTFEYADDLNIFEINDINKTALKIHKQEEKEMEAAKHGR